MPIVTPEPRACCHARSASIARIFHGAAARAATASTEAGRAPGDMIATTAAISKPNRGLTRRIGMALAHLRAGSVPSLAQERGPRLRGGWRRRLERGRAGLPGSHQWLYCLEAVLPSPA